MERQRAHDVGASLDFNSRIDREADEAVFQDAADRHRGFHHEWEARVFALNRLLLLRGVYNLDEFRYAVERMPAAEYLATGYYERWFLAIERLLREKGVVT